MRQDYMVRLERWARWMLPRQEAEEVVADYRDIVSDEELFRELGKPRDAIKPLAQPKQYYTWLAVFAVMAVCILALGVSPTMIGYKLWWLLFDGWPYAYPYGALITAALGAVTALVWFRRTGRKDNRLPKAIPILLGAFLICIGGVMWFCWACARDFDAFLEMWGTMNNWFGSKISRSFYLLRCAMAYGSTIVSFFGAFALVKARVGDRRWAAVYVLAMTAMLAALLVVALSNSMSVISTTPEEQFRSILTQCSVIAAIGLAGTGVALC